jgi:hypothetical protein
MLKRTVVRLLMFGVPFCLSYIATGRLRPPRALRRSSSALTATRAVSSSSPRKRPDAIKRCHGPRNLQIGQA